MLTGKVSYNELGSPYYMIECDFILTVNIIVVYSHHLGQNIDLILLILAVIDWVWLYSMLNSNPFYSPIFTIVFSFFHKPTSKRPYPLANWSIREAFPLGTKKKKSPFLPLRLFPQYRRLFAFFIFKLHACSFKPTWQRALRWENQIRKRKKN